MHQAVSTVWRHLPEDARTIDRVEQESRRLLEGALRDLQEDETAFQPGG